MVTAGGWQPAAVRMCRHNTMPWRSVGCCCSPPNKSHFLFPCRGVCTWAKSVLHIVQLCNGTACIATLWLCDCGDREYLHLVQSAIGLRLSDSYCVTTLEKELPPLCRGFTCWPCSLSFGLNHVNAWIMANTWHKVDELTGGRKEVVLQ